MRQHKVVNDLIREAESQRRCLYGADDASRRALHRRLGVGELVAPYPNVYARAEYWRGLNACQQSLHVARALHLMHLKWVFAGLTAIDAYGFDHTWRMHAGELMVADDRGRGDRTPLAQGAYTLRRVFVPAIRPVMVAGIPVTGAARSLVDCASEASFLQALPMFDSAIRRGVDMDEVRAVCRGMRADCTAVERALRYANGKCENGGESMTYGVTVLSGFAVPEFQVEFRTADRTFRVDFLWRLHDGRIIVLEYDGMRKYSDPSMAGRRSVKQVVGAQLNRDQTLRTLGVTTVLHCDYDDVVAQKPLVRMLSEVGVPWVGRPW
ncbi:hypothetical protein JS528_09365 [Bifidobacterium sp. MA2]|uniref:CTP synthase n=1 Tax=Bifidobacterium santillanense TaxID=2809028 RepID=A0ABS5URF2_9BIFI|nr:hypothetical protein [Bifidobacterium santillanense]MBT1173542.1 hypothetical protein [Bifidobacterium santillanense]